MKIIDWKAFWLSLLQLSVAIFFLLIGIADHPGFLVLGSLLAPLGMLQIVQSLRGTVFESDRVRFTSFMLRRQVVLSDIKAANCEFGVRFSPMLLFALAGASGGCSGRGRGRKSGGSMSQRSYLVNLSGDFGSAQVRFYGKRWRDAFLMALRDRAPRCRITRWS